MTIAMRTDSRCRWAASMDGTLTQWQRTGNQSEIFTEYMTQILDGNQYRRPSLPVLRLQLYTAKIFIGHETSAAITSGQRVMRRPISS